MGLPEVEAGVAPATGGAESFEAFYVREYPAVVRLAYALSGSRLVAEDIAQDAFLRAFHDWQRIRRPSAWVRKVAVRRAGRTVQRRLLEARALARLVAGRGPAVAELPEPDAEVWRAVRALPRRQAQVIALRYVTDAPVAEIARTLGLAEGTVKAQLHRGRQALAARLATAGGRTTMTDERLHRAAVALERSVAELDVQRRLEELGRRHRRRRLTSLAMALVVSTAVLGGAVAAVRRGRGPEPAAGPTAAPPARVVATLPLPGTPVAVAVGAGGVWVVAADRNQVVRLDPGTGRVVATVPLPVGPAQLALAPDALWVLSPPDNSVSRIDPATGRVVATVPVGREASGLALAAGSVWVSSALDDEVIRIDAATNRVAATIPTGRAPGALAVAGGSVWVALPERGGLGRVDPAGNRLTVVRVPRCCVGGLAGGEGALWAANAWDGTLVRLDPRSGRVLARTALPLAAAQHPWQVAAGDGAVWVTSASDRLGVARVLWRVGPATGRLAGSMTLGPASSRRIPDAVATGDGTLWVASGDGGAVLRLAPRP